MSETTPIDPPPAQATEPETAGADVLTVQEGPTAQSLAPGVEAALLSCDKPVGYQRLAEALELVELEEDSAPDQSSTSTEGEQAPTESERSAKARRTRAASADRARRDALARAKVLIESAITLLNQQYESTGRGFRIEALAGGYRVMTLPQHARVVANLHRQRVSTRLTKAAIETLAIIAYKQPMTRAQLEAIRGVACGEVLRSLMDRRLITMKGRAEELGRPILYGTTRQFLDHFGLPSLTDLPSLAELKPV